VGNAHIQRSTGRGIVKPQSHSDPKRKLELLNATLRPAQAANLLDVTFEAFAAVTPACHAIASRRALAPDEGGSLKRKTDNGTD
jgi:hypothetical protein